MNNNFIKTKKILNELMKQYPYDSLKEDNSISPISRSIENDNLKIIGITGSYGKTTTAYIVHEYLKLIGKRSVLYSSAGIDSPLSNYDSSDEVEIPIFDSSSLINALNGAIKYKADNLIIEVNERTIEKGYLHNIPFSIKAITNLYPCHNTLQYTKEEYIEIKKSFFKDIPSEDDTICIYPIFTEIPTEEFLSLNNKPYKIFSSVHIASVKNFKEENIDYLLYPTNDIFHNLDGLEFGIRTKNKSYPISSKLIMPFNGLNITLAMAILDTLNEFSETTFNQLLKVITIPGRDEIIKINNRTIIISITCTPHLEILKGYKEKGLINNIKLVTGSFGNGFNTWLPEYKGEAFKSYVNKSMKWVYNYIINNCDYVYITSNDNASSSIQDLLETQVKLVDGKIPYEAIINRKEAIEKAINDSKPQDVIFISGRGNRRMFCYNNSDMDFFLDKDVVEKKIKNMEE